MLWTVWKGFKAVGWSIYTTIFWCNRGEEEEQINVDNRSARVFAECNLAIQRHVGAPGTHTNRIKLWSKSFSQLCLASRAGRRPILALILREESDQLAQAAAKFLLEAQSNALNDLLQTEFILVAFTMSSPPIVELGNVISIQDSDVTLIFGHVTHGKSLQLLKRLDLFKAEITEE